MKRTFILLTALIMLFSVPFSAASAADAAEELHEVDRIDYDGKTDGTWVPVEALNIEFWYPDSMFGLTYIPEDEDYGSIFAFLTYVVDQNEVYISAERVEEKFDEFSDRIRDLVRDGALASAEFFLLNGMPCALYTQEDSGEFLKVLDIYTDTDIVFSFMYFGTVPEEESIFTQLIDFIFYSVRKLS